MLCNINIQKTGRLDFGIEDIGVQRILTQKFSSELVFPTVVAACVLIIIIIIIIPFRSADNHIIFIYR